MPEHPTLPNAMLSHSSAEYAVRSMTVPLLMRRLPCAATSKRNEVREPSQALPLLALAAEVWESGLDALLP